MRERGRFGTVQIHWQIYDNKSGLSLQPGTDFDKTKGFVTFMPQETTKAISIIAKADNIPEYAETFKLRLVNATGKSQGLSQDLETGCLKLAIVNFLGIQIFKGDHNILRFHP